MTSSSSPRSATGWPASATATSSGSTRSAACSPRKAPNSAGDVAARITYWCTAEGTIVLLTVFRKTRQHDQRQIDRAVRAQKACEREHRGAAAETYERQV